MSRFKKGDTVIIRCEGRTVPGEIVMASENGVSIMLGFDAMIDGHVGMMPVLRGTDGGYYSIVTGIAVELTP